MTSTPLDKAIETIRGDIWLEPAEGRSEALDLVLAAAECAWQMEEIRKAGTYVLTGNNKYGCKMLVSIEGRVLPSQVGEDEISAVTAAYDEYKREQAND